MLSKSALSLCGLALVVLVAFAPVARAYSSGAPAQVCGDLKPQHHGLESQAFPAPYALTAAKQPSGQYLVKIEGNAKDNLIKGFVLQAKQNGGLVGQFSPAGNDKLVQVLKCNDSDKSAVTHKKITEPVRSVSVLWDAGQTKGEVIFNSTIALNGGVFWVGVKSAPLNLN